MKIFRKIINYKGVKIETVGDWILLIFFTALVRIFFNFMSIFFNGLFQ